MRRIVIVFCVFSLGFVQGAIAAELPARIPMKAPVAAPAWNWTGLYAGLNGGYGWGSTDYSFAPGGSGDGVSNLFSNNAGSAFSHNLKGGVFGGHIGFNYQVGNIVTGLESSFEWSNIKGSVTDLLAPTVPPTTSYDTKVRWFATLTPRLGYAWDNWLVYGKGGLAAGRIDNNLMHTAGVDIFGFSDGHDHIGWTLGAGIEYAWINNVIVGLEYNYYDLRTQHYGGVPSPNTASPLDYTVHPKFSTVLARVSYKWDGARNANAAYAMATKAQPVAAGNWTGLYAGLNGGYGWGKSDYSFAQFGSGDANGIIGLFSDDDNGSAFGHNMKGGVFGGHVGFNYQIGHIVAGLESSFEWSNIKGSVTDPLAPPVPPTASYDTQVRWLATITPRLGYAWDNWLVYGKAGLAAARIDSNLIGTSNGFGRTFSDAHDHIGRTLGAGVEYAWTNNVIVGLEYNYYDLRVRPETSGLIA